MKRKLPYLQNSKEDLICKGREISIASMTDFKQLKCLGCYSN